MRLCAFSSTLHNLLMKQNKTGAISLLLPLLLLLLLLKHTDSVTGDNRSEMTNFRSYDTGRLQAAVAISILIDVFLTLWSG